ncbi:MAG: PSD1 and planctomycete cytochrome C domain-containing protein [Gemmataceae bacterium]|nr:PSD1 and planctomycete cytochrome C domain-containing protein [Gemmataceae bacterium]
MTHPVSQYVRFGLVAFLGLALGATATLGQSKDPPLDPDHAAKMTRGLDLFKKHVRPVLEKSCLRCHGGKDVESGFDLSDREGLLKGGDAGPSVILGKGKDSYLTKLITHAREPHMPHKARKLSDETIGHISAWIDNGAPYDEPLVVRKKGPSWTETKVAEDARQFWSFQPLARVEPPAVKNMAACKTPIDRFLRAKLEAAGVEPNPPVGKGQLIRRVYFDVTGLPPTVEELESALADKSEQWFEKLVDKLLASPAYGERWGRHWLDLARWAESHGFEHDTDRLSAYHYRDFVIQALNDDLPYDKFVKWQVAGDEYEPNNNLALTATGFLAAGVHSTQITKKEVEKHRYDELDDMTQTVGTAMLGLTLGCARCHDHKFDPIPQRDYYRLISTFTTTVRSEIDLNTDPVGYARAKSAFDKEHEPLVTALKKFETEQLPSRRAALEKAWQANPDRLRWAAIDAYQPRALPLFPLIERLSTADPEWIKLVSAVQQHEKKAPKPTLVKALISTEGLPAVRLHTQGGDFLNETHFLKRGDPDNKEGVATASFLQVLMPGTDQEKRWQSAPPQGWRTSYRRRAMAEWLTDVDNGAGRLLARVIVNRLWQHHMGKGIVATPSDFGVRGERPTHPELLDWLATELIKSGWRLKTMHKLILTSASYQQGSQRDEAKLKADSENRLFWRRQPKRLEAEAIRDALLTVSGELDAKMFGPGTLKPESQRRSIYFTVKRSKMIPMMTVFDGPDALGGLGERPTTTIAPQALLLMNNPQVRACARSMARRIAPDAKVPLEDAIKSGYLRALSRPPSDAELKDSLSFVKEQQDAYKATGKGDGREAALTAFCQVLMCLNEFVYVD